jgi:benzoyl-CoA reductase/2-hydroxyglutaryl-CoA dehydratase subunit BcrC/BadD/HgdB
MTDTLDTLQEIREINSCFPYTAPIKAWKEQGKKVIAFQCDYVPEEVIYAAGILPIRLTGDSGELGLEEANAYMYVNTCSFIRSCIELVLRKKYDFLDGFVSGATCDCSRRLADVWIHYGFTPFVHIFSVPRKITQWAYGLYEAEVRDLQHNLEGFFEVEITDEALWKAIEVYNKRRELFKKLHELRKLDAPPISGAETLEVLNASSRMPPDQFNNVMERLVEEAGSGMRAVEGKFRLMVNGSPLNNPEFMQAIEELGGMVVIDELCTGIRYWWEGIDPDPDPIKAICRRYLHNFPCPRMEPFEERAQRALKIARDYRIDGVVTEMVRYCVPWTMEQPLQRVIFEGEGIPVLELDLEYGTPGTGPIRTRVQAFLEMLEAKAAK